MRSLLLILILLCVLAAPASAANREDITEFSKYSPALRLVERADGGDRGYMAKFVGTVVVTGKLVIEFDRPENTTGSNDQIDKKGLAFFEPDLRSAAKLPTAIGTFYPAPVKSILLDKSPKELLASMFGSVRARAVLNGRSPRYEFDAELAIKAFVSWVECDHRGYSADVVKVAPLRKDLHARSEALLMGC